MKVWGQIGWWTHDLQTQTKTKTKTKTRFPDRKFRTRRIVVEKPGRSLDNFS